MRLSQKLILFVLAAAVIPLSFAGFWLLRQSEDELSRRLEREQGATALATAEGTGAQLIGVIDTIARAAVLIDWPTASRAETLGGLQLLAGQSPLVAGVVLVDAARQADLPAPVAGAQGSFDDGEALLRAMPLATLSEWGEKGLTAVGAAQQGQTSRWLPVAIQVGPKGPTAPMIVVALALQPLDGWLAARAPADTLLEVVDGEGRVVASSAQPAALAALRPSRLEVVKSGQPLFVTRDQEQVAVSEVPQKLGLHAVVSTPLERARAPVVALRRTILGGMGITALLLVVGALLFAGNLTRRLERVAGAAEAFARGDLSTRVDVGGEDELSDLSRTFNQMGGELETSRARLLKWNDELKQRVDEATADLRAAQAQLIETQKLAAIGQLGAGVAHEINNPLVGILGNAQLLMLDHPQGDPDFEVLHQIEENAKRCRDITQNLLRFSQTRGEVSLRATDLNAVVRQAMAFEQPRHDEAKIEVKLELAPGELLVDGDFEQLSQVLSQLCSNARTALRQAATRRITVTTRPEPGGALLVFEDTGKGISAEHRARIFEPFFTTKDVWSNIGLGLSLVYRIIDEHHGRIEVDSEPGKGARFTVHLHSLGTVVKTPEPTTKGQPEVGGVGVGIVR